MQLSQMKIPGGRAFVLDGATIIDGTGVAPIPDATVMVEDGLISYVGPRAGLTHHPNVEVVDVRGRTILPGLIDLHVHSTFLSDMQAYIENGVTGIRFAGIDQASFRSVVSRTHGSTAPSPRLFTLGPMLDVSPPSWPEWTLPISTPAEARETSERLIQEGAQGLIVVQRIGPDLLRPILEVAHSRSLPVVGQIWRMDAGEASALGIDQLDNSSRIALSRVVGGDALFDYRSVSERLAIASRVWSTIDWSGTERLMEAMVRHGVAYCPTLAASEQSVGLARGVLEDDPLFQSLFGDAERTAWAKFTERTNATWSAQQLADARTAFETRREWIRRFRGHGGQVLVGTDMQFGGIMIHRELALLADVGLTPLEVISSATGGAAAAMHVDDRIGTLKPGKMADLLIVDADPLADLANLRRLVAVIQGGNLIHAREPNLLQAT